MRFLADESCDFRVVRALRAAGHDVTAVIEVATGAADGAVFQMAEREQIIFVTEDRDFGQLVYAGARPACGVILLRFPSTARTALPAMVCRRDHEVRRKASRPICRARTGAHSFRSAPSGIENMDPWACPREDWGRHKGNGKPLPVTVSLAQPIPLGKLRLISASRRYGARRPADAPSVRAGEQGSPGVAPVCPRFL